MPAGTPSASEDLAFFGLCKESQHEDRRAEIGSDLFDSCDDEYSGGLDETVLYLLSAGFGDPPTDARPSCRSGACELSALDHVLDWIAVLTRTE